MRKPRPLLAPLRWLLERPWRVFWCTVAAFYVVVLGLAFADARPLPATVGRGFALAVFVLLAASFILGLRASWRRSRRGALTRVVAPVLLLLVVFGGGALLRTQVEGRARHAKASADARELGQAVTGYTTHMGRLPARLADLTTPARNASGATAGPFIGRLPTPPPHWTDYRYEPRADGTFTITSGGEGRVATFPARQRASE